MSTLGTILTRVVLPLALVGGGVGVAAVLYVAAPTAESRDEEAVPVPVEVVEVQPQTLPAIVRATGTVEAGRQVGLVPEVQGRVSWVDERVRPGGRFDKGQALLRIDARDYTAALASAEAQLAQSELNLALEQKRQLTAEREWELVSAEGEADPLALRRPHLRVAEANVKSARKAVERAELNVARTTLRAPFNAIVVSESVDEGQVVGGSPVVTLVGTDTARVVVSVPVEKLSNIDLPGINAEIGSPARVVLTLGDDARFVREGVVTGVSGQLDPQTRTARVVVGIDDPMGSGDPLLPGSFVDVEIVGQPLQGVFPVPRTALDGADAVWVAAEGRLNRREVAVGWRAQGEVYVTDGLEPGDRVVVTGLSNPIDGMRIDATPRVASRGEE